jgi:hypothetical protein
LNEKRDKRLSVKVSLLVATAFLAFTIVSPSTVFAAAPHFVGTPTINKVISGNTANLFTSGKVAGLGSAPTNFFLSASGGSATYQCVNPGGNSPPPKVFTFGPLQGQIVTITPRNGQITFVNIVLPGPPAPSPTQVGCPNPNWNVALLHITFNNVVLHLVQNGQEVLTFNFGDVDP